MNLSLFKAMYITNGKLIGGFAFGSFFYLWLLIWLYPTIADSQAMEDLIRSMPPEMLNAFGLTQGFGSIEAFIAGEYYGLLFIVILLIYSVMTSTGLVARLVDHGSMAYLLSTGASRLEVIMTQIAVLISGLLIISCFTFISGVTGTTFVIDDVSLEIIRFFKLNIVGFLLFYVVCSYCFLISSLVNDEKKALGLSAGISLLLFIFDLAGKMSVEVEWLRSMTVFSLFAPQEIAVGVAHILTPSLILFGIGTLLFSIAAFVFVKRDLPL
jgi:ABC-2 type transport system permease protein